MVISKSEFLMFLKHPAWLWLKKFQKDKLPVPDESLQALFDEGLLFEAYAEKLFPGAVKLGYKTEGEFSGTKYYDLPRLTTEELEKGTEVILQGRVEANNPPRVGSPSRVEAGITSIFDVLEKVGERTYNLYEIKSSTKVKPEHIPDLAFQTLVLEGAGLKVEKQYVLHVNNEYVRKGEIDPVAISTKTDVTEEVQEMKEEVREQIEVAFQVLKQKQMPDLSPRYLKQGWSSIGEWVEIIEAVKGKLPEYSIYKLATVSPKNIEWLEDNGIEVLGDIPLDAPLTDKQLRQVEAMRLGEQKVDRDEVKGFLDSLQYPLHFFDYETMAGVIPAFDGYRPYQQVPFQYSLHIQEEPGGELIHKEYLHTENTDPVPELLKALQRDFAGSGSVVSWYMAFEKGRNSEMAQMYPEYEKFLLGLNDRMVDLMTPFSKGWFVDKDFFGSASIKAVLPVLLPDLTYKGLNVSNGAQAQRVWMDTVLGDKNKEKKDAIMKDLREYCTLDTYAMYAIFKYLSEKIT